MKRMIVSVLAILSVSAATTAYADEINLNLNIAEAPVEQPAFVRFGLGVRVGGYGFKHLNENDNVDWTACRMNGVGVYGTLDVGRHFFTEFSLDAYHTTSDAELNGLERKSFHTQLAIGARFFPDFIVTPYLQMGGGSEFSYAKVYGAETYTIAPVGFVGLGGELNLGDMKLGMAIRSLAMPLPKYDWDAVEGHVNWEMEFAGQALFTARYVF